MKSRRATMAGLKDMMERKRVVKTTPRAYGISMKSAVKSRWLATDEVPFWNGSVLEQVISGAGHGNYRCGMRGACEGSGGVTDEREPRGSTVNSEQWTVDGERWTGNGGQWTVGMRSPVSKSRPGAPARA